MNTVGIISEYNPFHNGHKYQIEAAREACGADSAVCIMSGSFVQRGEPAVFDKWSRARMAVLSGADLVLELPLVYACQPAEIFAHGAVKILDGLGIIDSLCFGSELGDVDTLMEIAALLRDEPEAFRLLLRKYLDEGNTYPRAVALALSDYMRSVPEGPAWDGDIINTPNNILGIEYIKSLMALGSSIRPVTVKRIVSGHNETQIAHSIASATAVRAEIKQNMLSEKIRLSVPPSGYEIIEGLVKAGKGPVFMEDFSDMLLYRLRTMKPEELKSFLNTKEGIEYRLKKYAHSSGSIEELIEKIKTKRYTRTFIQRLLCHILFDLREGEIRLFKSNTAPAYARVLAFNDRGKELLKRMKKSCSWPVITKTADFRPDSEILEKMFYFDILSTDIYNLGHKPSELRKAGEDFYTSPVYL